MKTSYSKKEIAVFNDDLMKSIQEFRKFPVVSGTIGKPAVFQIKNRLGEDALKAIIVVIICDAMEYFNVSRPMSDSQISLFAKDFVQIRTHDSVHDLICMLHMAIQGRLSNPMHCIDIRTLNQWWAEYMDVKAAETESMNDDLKKKVWSSDRSNMSNEQLNALSEFKVPKPDEPVEIDKRSTLEKWIERFKKDFWPNISVAKREEYTRAFERSSTLSVSYEELHKWCIENMDS